MEAQFIVCRNVLIYFDDTLQERVLELFGRSLQRRGVSAARARRERAGDRKSNRMSTSIAHVWGVSGMHTGDCWVDFSKPVARDFSV